MRLVLLQQQVLPPEGEDAGVGGAARQLRQAVAVQASAGEDVATYDALERGRGCVSCEDVATYDALKEVGEGGWREEEGEQQFTLTLTSSTGYC